MDTLHTVEAHLDAPKFFTYIEILRYRALHQPHQYAYTFLVDGEKEEVNVTYEELDRKARAIASVLQHTIAPGERALLLYPSSLDYVFAFYGCLYAGIIAVPAYPPSQNRHLSRIQTIIADSQAKVVLTTGAALAKLQRSAQFMADMETLLWLATEDGLEGDEADWQEPAINGETIAFLQYTSGSTSTPKGVMVSHYNLMHNNRLENEAIGLSVGKSIVCWLPLFHDMGMISNMILALYTGARCVLMAPQAFLQKPARWLQAIARYGAYMTCAPNFAYDLCVQRITPEQMDDVDLSSCKVAISGAEPVRYHTLQVFWNKFAPYGFQWNTFAPGYGLAESTVAVSLSSVGEAPLVMHINQDALATGRIIEVSSDDKKSMIVVGCGRSLLEQRVLVVDTETLVAIGEDQVGELWLLSPSVTNGYWMRPEETAATFQGFLADGAGPFLRTGDLGFLHEGQIFIVGRIKDVIIIRGRNHYPQDIEMAVEECHPALRRAAGAAFSIDVNEEEQLVVVQEIDRSYGSDLDVQEVFSAIRTAVLRQHELHVYAIALIKHNSIPKTSSGKIQRDLCRKQFLMEELSFVEVSVLEEDDIANGVAPSEVQIQRDTLIMLDTEEQFSLLISYLNTLFSRILHVDIHVLDLESHLSSWGLDSLKAASLKSQLESDLLVDVPIVTLLQDPTVADLARLILTHLIHDTRNSADSASIQSWEPRSSYPLSFSQEQIWVLTQLDPETTFYNMPFIVQIKGAISPLALEWSINKIVERHETLRMTFALEDGFPVQCIQPAPHIQLVTRDLTTLPASLQESETRNLFEQDIALLFDLSQGPLLRVMLLRLRDDEHLLQITFHHITCDGWSMNVLLKEMQFFYKTYLEVPVASTALPVLPVRYVDFILWQREWLEGERLHTQLAYWKRQLHDLQPLELPTDRPHPPVPNYRGEVIIFEFTEELRQGLKELGRQTGATLFMTLVATFMLVLGRYSRQRDIAIGTLIANRVRKEVEHLIGCFINTLVLRCDLTLEQSFLELLKQVRQTVFDAYANQDVPFEKVVETLRPDRHLSHFPFFQVMLVLQSVSQAFDEQESVTFEPFEGENIAAIHDIYISALETPHGIRCQVRYNIDVFEHATIQGFLEHWRVLMENIIAAPQQPLSTLSLMTPLEYGQIVTQWNKTYAPYPLWSTYQELFVAQMLRTPEKTAATYRGRSLSYRQLDQLSNRLAHALRERGVGPDVLVGIYMERSLEMLVSILAVFKAGGAYLPLELYYPDQRVAFILKEAQTHLVLIQPSLHTRLKQVELPIFALDEAWEVLAAYSDHPLAVINTPASLAYVMFTSGSTGQPKGVMVAQGGMLNHMLAKIDAVQLGAEDILAQTGSQCFDISVWQFLAALVVGGQVHIIPDEIALNPSGLFTEVMEHNISVLQLVPAHIQALITYIQVQEGATTPTLPLRWMIPTGDICPPRLVNQWFHLFPNIPLLNTYGTTECSDDNVHAVLEAKAQHHWQKVPIGRPIPNTQLYILDEHFAVVPVGVPGYIYNGGICVGRGYLNDSVRTALAFVPNPFTPGERLYRTGDLGRYLHDGQVEFIGRVDQQVKIRGYRIELGEIEAILDQHPAVREAVVSVYSASTTMGSNDMLVAYVVLQDQTVTEDHLRAYLLQKLPDYMSPAHFLFLDALPLTNNGKIDRRSLPVPERTRDLQEVFVAPRSELEEALVHIWQQVLEIEPVRIYDNFFQAGGYSLSAVQMLAMVRDHLHVDIPLRRFFEGPTIASLALLIEESVSENVAKS